MTTHDLILIGAAALAAFIGAKVASAGKADTARLAQLEKKVNQLLSQAGLDTNAYLQSTAGNPPNAFSASVSTADSASADMMDLIRRGRKIEAIKLYRQQNPGTDLKHAKDAVEQIERSIG
jgi:ribosomal protein L7/L12